MAVAPGHKNWISFDMQIVIARYSRFISWRYKYSSSLLIILKSEDLLTLITKVRSKPIKTPSNPNGYSPRRCITNIKGESPQSYSTRSGYCHWT